MLTHSHRDTLLDTITVQVVSGITESPAPLITCCLGGDAPLISAIYQIYSQGQDVDT